MDRQTGTVIVIAAVSILSVGLAAATLSETVQPGEGGDSGSDGGFIDLDLPEDREVIPTALARIILVGLVLTAATAALYMVRHGRRTGEIVAFLLGFAVVFWLFVQLVAVVLDAGDIPLFGSGLPGVGDSAGETATTAVSALLVVIAVVGILAVAIGLAIRQSSDSSTDTGEDEQSDRRVVPDQSSQSESIGQIAGQTADRIEHSQVSDATVDNEIYRAWEEMTRQLDVPDEDATTPREFARVATEAGLSSRDVAELTELFEDIRYGGRTATDEREQRAVAILRRIEQTDR